jgi:hypothetical protein
VEKYCRAGPDTDDIIAHMHCMLDTQGYKHTLRICDIALPLQQLSHYTSHCCVICQLPACCLAGDCLCRFRFGQLGYIIGLIKLAHTGM